MPRRRGRPPRATTARGCVGETGRGNRARIARRPSPGNIMVKVRRFTLTAIVIGATLASTPAYARNPFEFHTPVAQETLHIHNLFLATIALMFAAGMGFLLYAVFRHRKSRGHHAALFTGPRTAAQWVLVTIPFLILVAIDYVVMGIPAYHAVLAMADTKRDATLVVKITGSQWKWRYEYPDEHLAFTSNLATPREQLAGSAPTDPDYLLEVDRPLVLPVGEKVRILLTSTDVIHSWWVPAFGVKQDAIPGFLRETWVRIESPGVYRGQCAELCGVGHAFMPIVVDAKPEPEFRKWLAAAKSDAERTAEESAGHLSLDDLVARGRKAYATSCGACHQENGRGLPGLIPPIAAGEPYTATPELTDKLAQRGFYRDGRIVLGSVDQHIDIVLGGIPGTPMPAFGPQLDDADIAAIVTYERNSFGNHTGEAVQPADVAKARRAPADRDHHAEEFR